MQKNPVVNIRRKYYLELTGLGLIIVLAFFLRIYLLSQVPPALSLDEVSLGYNAYSVARTGADEYGSKFPILLRAYDDWRPALYIYAIIPFLPIFGLSPLAVRLPAAIAGTFTILVFYLLVKELTNGQKSFKTDALPFGVASIASLMLAISPWHIYISRLGHEVNLGFFFLLVGVYGFLRWQRTGGSAAIIVFYLGIVFSLYSYQSQKIVTPLWFFGLLGAYWRAVRFRWKQFVVLGIIFGLLLLPLLSVSLTSEGLTRFAGTSVFNYHPFYLESDEKLNRARLNKDLVGKIVYQPPVTAVRIFVDNFGKHLKPEWLFGGKLLEAHKIPYLGLMYSWELIFILAGIWYLWRQKESRLSWLVLFFVFSSILPGALTTQAPHAMRTFTAAPFVLLVAAIGTVSLGSLLKNNLRHLFWVTIGVLVVVSLIMIRKNYFQIFPAEHASSFSYSLELALSFAREREKEYDQIVIASDKELYQSYMFYLFQSQFDPDQYQNIGGTDSGGYAATHNIGKYEFGPVNWRVLDRKKRILVLVNLTDAPVGESVKTRFSDPDGTAKIAAIEL